MDWGGRELGGKGAIGANFMLPFHPPSQKLKEKVTFNRGVELCIDKL